MATLWERLTGRQQTQQLAQQLSNMQSTVDNLTAYTNQLQTLLTVQFKNQGGFTRFDTVQQIGFIRQGYNINADVYAIVSDIAQKGASIPLIAYEVVDDAALKIYRSAMSQKDIDFTIANKYKRKALRQVEADNPIQKLIDTPNIDDNTTTFYETSLGFYLLCGNNYWYAPSLDLGADMGKVVELRIMPSQFVGLIIVQGYPSSVIGYELIIDGVRLMESKDVIHMRTPNYDWQLMARSITELRR